MYLSSQCDFILFAFQTSSVTFVCSVGCCGGSGESYYFVFEKWFAVEKGDGKVEREVMAADRGLGFSKVTIIHAHCSLLAIQTCTEACFIK